MFHLLSTIIINFYFIFNSNDICLLDTKTYIFMRYRVIATILNYSIFIFFYSLLFSFLIYLLFLFLFYFFYLIIKHIFIINKFFFPLEIIIFFFIMGDWREDLNKRFVIDNGSWNIRFGSAIDDNPIAILNMMGNYFLYFGGYSSIDIFPQLN